MILSDFLSKQKHDNNNPHEIIPISFNMQNVLLFRYYNIGERKEDICLVQTRLQARSSGIALPNVQGVDKGIDPNVHPEKQVIKPILSSGTKGINQNKPRLGQGRSGIKKSSLMSPHNLSSPYN